MSAAIRPDVILLVLISWNFLFCEVTATAAATTTATTTRTIIEYRIKFHQFRTYKIMPKTGT
jgi:hypothetical protein